MPSLKEVRIRINSVNSTRQITSAMKMVAASKLRRAQNAILNMRPYAQKLQHIMQDLSSDMEGSDEGLYSAIRDEEKILIVTITSNRGLCGAFNANVVKSAISLAEGRYAEQYKKGNLSIMCLGKKGADGLKSYGITPVEVNNEIFDDLTFDNAVPIAEHLMAEFAEKKYDKIILIYNQFKNAAVQLLQEEQFLPVVESDDGDTNGEENNSNYIFEPNKEEILEALVPKAIKVQLYKALLDSFASEHGARMTAMHKATENADELIKDLKLTYNKARQASITNEILEIVGGAEALNN
ncbi:MAG: ATP synthase F1 subunit gamma [Lentimicrobiaceae bacterium]|jgi:F-type H+-transporting ATPase subunit gamma|nr:ATP synthase F1 subunit gamma [Lentimicrobiaceae bacterium]MBT3454475.1 ATP synthase F1 subunit gamma [Lentimicrobiaceae bacterium]MBT3819281.1 ATP synthase F1 subunit gamma [Lentimicrobiaceae bacterium]MBT4061035.1 ATP synthase F1 subunit gamma [Lentimicrobiaceae bacterium]MBT4189982.1 ATP synthase F1 subunit gamma [Lentimicrobiaceae bacterium]